MRRCWQNHKTVFCDFANPPIFFFIVSFKDALVELSAVIFTLRPGVQQAIINWNSPTFVWQFQSTVGTKRNFLSLLWFAFNRRERIVGPLSRRDEACRSGRDKSGTNCIDNGAADDSLLPYQVSSGAAAKHLRHRHDCAACCKRGLL